MKNLVLIIVVFMSHFLAVCNANADDKTIAALLEKPFIKADFTKQRKLKILSKPFSSSGIILFSPETGVVWHTQKPLIDTLIIKNTGEIRSLRNKDVNGMSDNPVIGSASKVFLTILSLKLEKIKELFFIENGGNDGDVYHYVLIPREQEFASIIEKIVLSGRTRMENIHIIEKSGDSTVVSFHNELFDRDRLNKNDHRLLDLLK